VDQYISYSLFISLTFQLSTPSLPLQGTTFSFDEPNVQSNMPHTRP